MRARCVAAAWLALCAGCSSGDPETFRRSWRPVDLPGFSITIPTGEVVHTSTETWTGKHQVKLAGSALDRLMNDVVTKGNVTVSWTAESYSHEEWSRQFLPAISSGMKGVIPNVRVLKDVQVDTDRWYAVIGNEQAPVAFGTVGCREFQVNIAYARYHDVEKQVADLLQVMSSVRCDENAQPRVRPAATTSLPAEFTRVQDEYGLQTYQTPDGESVSINFTHGDVQRDEKIFMAIMRPLLAGAYGVDETSLTLSRVDTGAAPHALTILRVVDSTGGTSYVGTQYCVSLQQSLLTLWSAPKVSDERAIERIGQVGCP